MAKFGPFWEVRVAVFLAGLAAELTAFAEPAAVDLPSLVVAALMLHLCCRRRLPLTELVSES